LVLVVVGVLIAGGALTTVHKCKMGTTGGVKKSRKFPSLNP